LFVAFARLFLILLDVKLLQLPHPLNLVEVHYETLVVRVVLLDALSAKNCQMIRAVEMLDPLGVVFTKLVSEGLFVFVIEIKVSLLQDGVFFYYFVKDIDI